MQQLLQLCPDSCVAHLWGIYPPPPEAVQTIELETTVTRDDAAHELFIEPGQNAILYCMYII